MQGVEKAMLPLPFSQLYKAWSHAVKLTGGRFRTDEKYTVHSVHEFGIILFLDVAAHWVD